jgi:hypothetical protein
MMAGIHRSLLTIYLWHITALMVSAGLWHAAGLPEPAIGSGTWWGLRPLWVLAAVLPLAVLVAVFGRFEVHAAPREFAAASPTVAPAAALGVFAVSVGLLGFGETGFLPLAPVRGEAVLMFDFNPLQNVVHLLVGGSLLVTLGRADLRVPAAAAGTLVFLALGAGHLAGLVDRLGMNTAGAVAHLAAGAAAAVWLAAARLRAPLGRAGRGSGA